MNDKYVLSSLKIADFYDFISDHKNSDNNFDAVYKKYENSPFAKFSWIMGADGSCQLVLFNYIIAKWIDKQITSSGDTAFDDYKLFFNNNLHESLNIIQQNIDAEFIDKMFCIKDNCGDLEDNLINLIGFKI